MTEQPIQKQEFRWSYMKKGKDVLNVCTRILFMAGFAGLMGLSTTAQANPTGGNVVGGSATINNTAAELQIHQSSQNALIEWNSFNIAAGETTHFYQPNSAATALNRVVNSNQLSSINGNLIANGHVLVINPNGVLIGKTGNVDTAGFVASTADTTNAAFMNATDGKFNLNVAGKVNGSVTNEGTITVADTGLVGLVAPTVRNDGVIQGNLAKIQLGAADTVGVDLYGDGLVNLAVSTTPHDLSVTNTGTVTADGGKVLMTAAAASNVVNSVINNTGLVEAHTMADQNGEIVLTGAGATVNVAGKLDASGANGGGTVKVGGGYQGSGTTAHASNVNVTQGAVIDASATDNGNGGTVVVWSDKATNFQGTALAKGGANGGNGGLVETSGHDLTLGGTVDASAANGAAGTHLIDPATINIKNGSGTATSNTVYEQSIESQSQGGTNVVLAATDTVTLENLADNELKGGKGSITLQATGTNGAVVFQDKADKISTTTGNITLSAGAGGVNIGLLSTTDGSISVTTTNAGNVTTASLDLGRNIGDTSTLTIASAGTLTVNGSINVDNTEIPGGPYNATATANLSSSGDMKVTGDVNVSAVDNTTCCIGSTATLNMTSANGSINVGGNVSAVAVGQKVSSGSPLSSKAALKLDAAKGDITVGGSVLASSTTTNSTATTAAPVSIASATLNAGKDVTVTGPVTVKSNLSNNQDQTATNTASLDVKGQNVALNGDVNVTATTAINDLSSNLITANTNATANIHAVNNVKVGNVYVNANGVIPVDTIIKLLSTSSSYNNSLGYYTYDANGNPVAGNIIWSGTSSTAAGATVTIPKGQSSIGFFLLSNGANANAGLANGQAVTFQKVGGIWQAFANGKQLAVASSGQGPFFSNSALNPDHLVHTATVNSTNTGWEDLQFNSDTDYNDAVVNIGPRFNNNNVNASLTIQTDAAGTGIVTAGNLEANANTGGTGTATSTLNVYSSGVMTYNGTHIYSTADGAAAKDNYVGFDINKTVTNGGDTAVEKVSSLHIIDVQANNQTKVYGDADPNLTYTAKFDYAAAAGVSTAGYLTGLLSRDAGKNVGTYGINQGGVTIASAGSLPIAGRYAIHYTGGSLTITQATLNLVASADTKTYDGTTSSSKTVTVTGLKGTDTVSGLSESFDSRNAGTRVLAVNGGYVVNDGNGGNNYKVVTSTAAGTINKANLTITAAGDTKVYDGTTDSAAKATVTGLVTGDTVNVGAEKFNDKNAGTKTLAVSGYTLTDGNGGNNYNVVVNAATGTITPRALTVTATGTDKTYDGTTSDTVTLGDNRIAGDNLTVTGTGAFTDKNAGTGKTVNVSGITLSGADKGNYTFNTTATTTATINKASLTLAAVTDSKVYDGTTTSTKAPAVSGAVAGDSVTGASQSFDSKDVGARTLSVNSGYVINDGNGGNNYVVHLTTASGTITKAGLIVTADGKTKVYGDADPSLTYTYKTVGLVSGDSLTGSLVRDAGENVGSYAIKQGSLSAGSNYNITYVGANLVITPATLNLAAATDTKVYDGTTTSTKTVTVTGLKGSDSITNLSESFDTKNAGSRTLAVNGGYVVNDGNGGHNYTVVTSTAAGTITPRALTVTATGTDKTYDGNTTDTVNLTDNRVTGDNLTVTGTGSFTDKNAGTGKTVNVTGITLTGTDKDNYTFNTTTTTTADINKANLVIAAAGDTKTYDGTTNSTATATVTGLVAGDTATVGAEQFDNKNAGSGKTLTVSGYTLTDGNGGNNYNVTVNNATGTINKASLVINANGETKTYDGTTAAHSGATTVGLVSGDTVSLGTTQYDGKNAGAHTITLTGYVLNDGNSGNNYNVTVNTAAGTITPATLIVTADGKTKVAGQTDPALTYSETGLVAGETAGSVLSGGLTRDKGEASGTYAINQGTLTANSNYTIVYNGAVLTITAAPATTVNTNVAQAFALDPLGRPIISVADKAINYYPPFQPKETKTVDVDVSIKGAGAAPAAQAAGGANALANLEPAAGGDDDNNAKKKKAQVANGSSADDLANLEPAAGGNGASPAAANGKNFACADDFLDGKGCPAQ